ncbi:hypothetical protein [Roseobacter sinensis]|uniref:Pilus assembly protein n=1 Tax=Roseobacter sinensis TaxID=2931391 RepID=A0ABT3BH44_9RHOB|nr:hypothetical protein [Roseobacter sp. WL0113]MCV3272867.1 hypothetical protein [Roseobacter sp. WL0113]
MLNAFQKFKKDEAGAVTVDWVVLTAAVVGLATALVIELRAGSSGVTENTETFLRNQEVGNIGATE